MRRQRAVSPAIFFILTLCFAAPILANQDHAQEPPSSAGVSHARVVSLSFVEGTVLARRPGNRKWDRATFDAPIEEGWSIATGKNSRAEVQFENGSTVRIGELSRLDFTQMALAPHKGRVNHLTLAFGFATIHVIPRRHDEYVINASGVTLMPHGGTEFRTDLEHGNLRVEVFHGYVRVADLNATEKLGKNQARVCDYSAPLGAVPMTTAVQMDEWDKWVKDRDEQADLAAYEAVSDPMNGWAEELNPLGGMLSTLYGGDSSF
jgi:hypothetical protein